ncbi:Chitinase B precursor [Pseudobythopirellula maris]|uniref:chitinase n=1 Tax=Pseudobythopirellula maris TaxID=2527991 RepID=A0A5C5ZPG4_9BACT|nr:glycoside hydrolase family 18 protein [Pseudobythopirellula maris]TWT88671.1 Chitinase B precursor [Pseudobythopirellula maris]
MRRLTSVVLLVLASILPEAAAAAPPRVMVGYYATYGDLPVEQLPFDELTHVCHAFLRTDAKGELVTTDAMPNPSLCDAAHEHGVKVLVTLGGGLTVQGLELVSKDPAKLQGYADRVVQLVRDNGYDGVDLDWEFPRDAATRAGHAALVAALREGLDAAADDADREAPYLLTAMVSPTAFFGQWIDAKAITPHVDWLAVMAYDLSGEWSRFAGHPAPLFASPRDPEADERSVAGAMRYWRDTRGVPAEKLVMGLPMYGRLLPVAEPYDRLDPAKAEDHRAVGYAEIRELVGKGWPSEWDNDSQAPWLQAIEGRSEVIGYDDPASVAKKAAWSQEQSLRGMHFWALHQDRMPDGKHWLLRAANKAWPAE